MTQPKQTKVINIWGGPGIGKAQPLTSNVLTPTGWIPMGEIKVGQRVVTPSGEIASVDYVVPQGEKQIYKITFHDGAQARACGEHLWKCWYVPTGTIKSPAGTRSLNKRSVLGVLSTEQLLEQMQRPMRGSFRCNVSIPLITPYDSSTTVKTLPISPYVLGILLGDGSFCTGAVTFTTDDKFILDKVRSQLKDGYDAKQYGDSISYGLHKSIRSNAPNYYLEAIKLMDLLNKRSDEKFIPDNYLVDACNFQKMELLQGLMDSDGTVEQKGVCSFTSTSKVLALQVQQMLWSLGCTCRISSRFPTFLNSSNEKQIGLEAYTLTFNAPDKSLFFSLPRKLDRIKPTNKKSLRRRIVSIELDGIEPAQCISINHPDHLYITDDFVVTHNSTVANDLYRLMKQEGVSVELVTEVAKDLIHEGQKEKLINCQDWVSAEQNFRQWKLVGNYDYIITDSPLLLGMFYQSPNYPKTFTPFLLDTFNAYNNINVYLIRNMEIGYNPDNRVHNLWQARMADAQLRSYLKNEGILHFETLSGWPSSWEIWKYLFPDTPIKTPFTRNLNDPKQLPR